MTPFHVTKPKDFGKILVNMNTAVPKDRTFLLMGISTEYVE